MTAPAPLAMWRIARPDTGVPAWQICAAISPAVALPSLPMTARTTAGVTAAGIVRPLVDARAARPALDPFVEAARERARGAVARAGAVLDCAVPRLRPRLA